MMASMRAEDRVEGASNFNPWKAKVMSLLEEYDLDGYVTSVMEEPSNHAKRVAYKRNQSKAKRVIFYFVK